MVNGMHVALGCGLVLLVLTVVAALAFTIVYCVSRWHMREQRLEIQRRKHLRELHEIENLQVLPQFFHVRVESPSCGETPASAHDVSSIDVEDDDDGEDDDDDGGGGGDSANRGFGDAAVFCDEPRRGAVTGRDNTAEHERCEMNEPHLDARNPNARGHDGTSRGGTAGFSRSITK